MLTRLLLGVALACLSVSAYAADVRLTWAAPTTCSDDSPLVNCPTTGFEVSESAAASGQPWGIRETVGATVTDRIYQLPPGTRCFYVKTLASGLKSDQSTVACVTVPVVPPRAPGGVTVTVQITVATP
jgi:hypothetical protein